MTFFFILIVYLFISPALGQDAELLGFRHLQQIFLENDQGKMNSYLHQEFCRYLKTYPASEQEDHILWMQAETYRSAQRNEAAFFIYLKLIFFHSKSPFAEQAHEFIEKYLLQSNQIEWTEKKLRIMDMLDQKPTLQSTHQQAYWHFLAATIALDIPSLSDELLDEIQLYKDIYQTVTTNQDLISYWQGALHETLGNDYTAVAYFMQTNDLFPESFLRSEALFRAAFIEYRKLGMMEQALRKFIEIINSFPNTKPAGQAQFYLAELFADSLHNDKEAISHYRLLTEAFPNDPFCPEALRRLAKLTYRNNDFEETIAAYMQFFEQFKEDDFAPEALDWIEKIYRLHLNDWQRATNILVLFATTYPDHEKAAEHLYRAAKINYSISDKKKEVKKICQRLIEMYPDSEFAGKAEKLMGY